MAQPERDTSAVDTPQPSLGVPSALGRDAGASMASGASASAARTALRRERLRRLALQLQVVTLQAELERSKRQREQVIQRYEEILAEREEASPVFSWGR